MVKAVPQVAMRAVAAAKVVAARVALTAAVVEERVVRVAMVEILAFLAVVVVTMGTANIQHTEGNCI